MYKLFSKNDFKTCREMVLKAYELNKNFSCDHDNILISFATWLVNRKIPLTDKQFKLLNTIYIELNEKHNELMVGVVNAEL